MKQAPEKFRTYKNVFDEQTLRILFKLSSEGYFEELRSPISIGKESNVFSAVKKDGSLICVKIYRVNTADFKRMYKYIANDNRFKGLQNKKRQIIYAWAQREYRNLLIARDVGVNVPTPYAVRGNVLLMQLFGDKEGNASPRLKDQPPKNPNKFIKELLSNLKKMNKIGLIHGDLSEFNILNHNEKPIIIDFSHGVKIDYLGSKELYERDVINVKRYAKKLNVKIEL